MTAEKTSEARAADRAAGFPFTVEVDYRLREYLSIVQDFAQYAHARSQDGKAHPLPKRAPGVVAKLAIALVAAPVFFYKRSRVGRCLFAFTGSGLARTSKHGRVVQVAWPEVRYVYRLSRAFLVVEADGAMPVPYRCLTVAQREWLEGFFSELDAARRTA